MPQLDVHYLAPPNRKLDPLSSVRPAAAETSVASENEPGALLRDPVMSGLLLALSSWETNPSLRSIFDICVSLDMRPSVFLRQVESSLALNFP